MLPTTLMTNYTQAGELAVNNVVADDNKLSEANGADISIVGPECDTDKFIESLTFPSDENTRNTIRNLEREVLSASLKLFEGIVLALRKG